MRYYFRKWMFETREDVDPDYQPLPEEQPGGFNWGERADGRPGQQQDAPNQPAQEGNNQ